VFDFTIPQGIQGVQGIQGIQGVQGIQGEPGVVTATSPATYDAPTQTVGVDQTAIAIQPSQVATLDALLDYFRPPVDKNVTYGPRDANSGSQLVNDRMYLVPFPLGVTRTLSKLRVRIGSSGTGSAGAVIRIGVYSTNGTYQPDALVLDAGTVDATVAAGSILTLTGLTTVLTPGMYWLAAVVQGSPTTRPFVLTATPTQWMNLTSDQANTVMDTTNVLTIGSVSGALPSSAAGADATNTGIRIAAYLVA
jgi:hypothetical protein